MIKNFDKSVFFSHARTSLFGHGLAQSQVEGLTAILDACPDGFALRWLAYCLATAFHETARTMRPIEEYGRGMGKAYGPSGYWGRGYVQLTWAENYRKATQKLRSIGVLRASEDLATAPALAMRPDVAAAVMFLGMSEGWFTGKKLSGYFDNRRDDPVGARRIINGTDCAAAIAGYHSAFVCALKAAGYNGSSTDLSTLPIAQAAPAVAKSQPARAIAQATGSGIRAGLSALWNGLHGALKKA